MNPYSTHIRNHNRRSNTLRTRRGIPYHALNVHFDNINILANIIQDSQVLLERYNTSWSPPRHPLSTQTNTVDITPFFMENIISSINANLQHQSTTPNDVSGSTTFPTNLNIHCVDASNIDIYTSSGADVSNETDLYDFQHFGDIPAPINTTCPITREAFTSLQNVLMIRQCHHVFNKEALMMWVASRNSCPLCRCDIRRATPPLASTT